ncbi:hypothetical protein SteCoe_19671 [Stentor coeruleus]|uniref:DNA polymerase n=1 Tax=Stentor coeruleus TaxID=5963 RepID=A0A1R2BTP8_9CILI|nr:hypothetical protein SteCoe_19671 [Stentor coeruleus]
MIFDGYKICVLSGFAGFTKMSGEIISKNISKNGGTIIPLPQARNQTSNLTLIIVPEQSDEKMILKVMNLTSLPSCPLVSPNWAINSTNSKTLHDPNDYQIKKTELPIKRQSPQTYQSPPQSPFEAYKTLPLVPLSNSPEMNRTQTNPILNQNNTRLHDDLLQNKDKYMFTKEQPNLNEHITSVLEILMENYFLLRDRGRGFAYRSAIIVLKSHPEKIICGDQVGNLQKVGKKIKKKIQEILETGTLKRVKAMDEQSRLKAIKEFSKIWGVGSATADKLFTLGYRTLDDLRKNIPQFLNDNQRICLELFDEIKERIPREEVKEISDQVVEYAKLLLPNKDIEANTCGSYRRGKETCGDIDILLTFDDVLENKLFLRELVDYLIEKKVVTHVLILSENCKKHESFTFEGIAKKPDGLHRRLDIKIYPRKYYAWALMHFTGSANFNRSIRLFAKNKGLKLTDEGLFPAIRSHGETICGGNLVECYTEEDIFRLFDMPYKPPEQRDL